MLRLAVILVLFAACSSLPPVNALPLPEPRHGHRVEALDGGLLAFGGFAPRAGATAGRRTYWLGPGMAAWQRRADMATTRSFFASVVIDGQAYAIGDGVERYEPANDRWVEVAPAGQLPHSHFAAAAVGREIFVLGGYPLERSGLWITDVSTGEVRAAAPPPGFAPGDHFHFLAAIDGALHVVGGLDTGPFTPRAEHWVRDAGEWRALTAPPSGLWAKFGGGVVQAGSLYLFGEFGGYRFDPARGWHARAGWGDLVAMPALVTVGSRIWSFGGMEVGGSRVPRVRIYDPAHDTWETVDK